MPRKPRFFLPEVPVHIVHRGHSRSAVFFEDQDYSSYAYWLRKAAERHDVSIHAFVLMTNHIHLLVTPKSGEHISRFMQFIGRRYVPYINNKYARSGSIWEGRYKASLVQEHTYLLSVMRYIELNPVRANIVERPAEYSWSSFSHNAGMRNIQMIKQHAVYDSLGSDQAQRSKVYQALFGSHLDKEYTKAISDAWLTGTPLGNDCFRQLIENTLGEKVGHDRRGRPRQIKGV